MISEFQDLSDKIDRLAELTHSLRRENATLRQSNALLSKENETFMERLAEAQRRVNALLATLPPDPDAVPEDAPQPPDSLASLVALDAGVDDNPAEPAVHVHEAAQ